MVFFLLCSTDREPSVAHRILERYHHPRTQRKPPTPVPPRQRLVLKQAETQAQRRPQETAR